MAFQAARTWIIPFGGGDIVRNGIEAGNDGDSSLRNPGMMCEMRERLKTPGKLPVQDGEQERKDARAEKRKYILQVVAGCVFLCRRFSQPFLCR
jgi:hypothetical protein